MTVSDNGITFICQFEGFRASPYRDATGIPTIGYGTIRYANGTAVKMTDTPISEDTAKLALKQHIVDHIDEYLARAFAFGLVQTHYDALVSFCYNLGTGALDKSSLRHAIINKASDNEITEDFCKWDIAGGHVLTGLLTRRQHEATLFTTGSYV